MGKKLRTKSTFILRELLDEIPVATEAPTTNPVLTERLDEIRAFRLAIGKEKYDVSDISSFRSLVKSLEEGSSFIYLRELSAKITYEIFQRIFKYIPIEFLDTPEMPKTLIEILKKILQEVLQEIQVLPDEMYELLTEIMIHRMKIAYSINEIMFKHYFDRDIEDGTSSSDERDYLVMMKELHSDLKKEIISSRDVELALDHFLELSLKDAGNA